MRSGDASWSLEAVARRDTADSAEAASHRGIVLIPWMVAGVQSQFEQMRHTIGDEGTRVIEIHPYRHGGVIERLPLPETLRATVRSTLTASHALPMREIRAVWTQVGLPVLPFALLRGGRRVPVFYAIDCTPLLLHGFGHHYRGVDDPTSVQGRLTAACLRLYFRNCAGLLPWSAWAARSMIEDYGASPEAVHVVAPGVDLEQWFPAQGQTAERPRLLFVGADFERKGGPLLLDVYRRHLRDVCELHMVTRYPLAREPGVHVHTRLKIGDPRLQELYQTSDALVLPTLADCFSMAALEAMACGLPVIISAVGGIPEIVIDGETGILIPAGRADSLLQALRTVLASAELRRRLGQAGRRRAERFFDARKQSETTLRIMSSTIAKASPRH